MGNFLNQVFTKPLRAVMILCAILPLLTSLVNCSKISHDPVLQDPPIFHAEINPEKLSSWNVLQTQQNSLALNEKTLPYSLATPLFTDYAHKLRTIWLPDGTQATYHANDVFDFPIGTIITKTFYYPLAPNNATPTKNAVRLAPDTQPVNTSTGLDLRTHRLLETRLLVHREKGWEAISYVWDDDQEDARLKRTGAIIPLTLHRSGREPLNFNYVVPNTNQCAGCHTPNHTSRTLSPIGPRGWNFNTSYSYRDNISENQLEYWTAAARLNGTPVKVSNDTFHWKDSTTSLDRRARAYLDANCGHCHNPVGPADTSGLHLNRNHQNTSHLGICKNAVAAGSGTGGRTYDITPGKPDASILLYRMQSNDPAAMMPELGRSLVHEEGVALISAWIASLPSQCEAS